MFFGRLFVFTRSPSKCTAHIFAFLAKTVLHSLQAKTLPPLWEVGRPTERLKGCKPSNFILLLDCTWLYFQALLEKKGSTKGFLNESTWSPRHTSSGHSPLPATISYDQLAS